MQMVHGLQVAQEIAVDTGKEKNQHVCTEDFQQESSVCKGRVMRH